MKKITWLASVLMAGALVSCGGAGSSDSTAFKASMAADGVLMDGGFNEQGVMGLDRAEKELGYQVSATSVPQASDYDATLDRMQQEGNDIILVVGYKMWDALRAQADFHETQKYAIIDFTGIDKIRPNVLPIGFKAEQGAFLAGYVAAKTSKTGKVGFIGGIAGVIIDMFDYGFEAGARYANPQIEVVKQYAETFADPAKGKSIANLMYHAGADVIFHAAGGTGLGVIEAAKELKAVQPSIWVIGADVDQSPLAPNAVLVSVLKKIDTVVYKTLADVKNGTFKGGEPLEFGLADGGIGLSNSPYVSAEIMAEVAKLEEEIKSNRLVPPYDAKGMIEFSRMHLQN